MKVVLLLCGLLSMTHAYRLFPTFGGHASGIGTASSTSGIQQGPGGSSQITSVQAGAQGSVSGAGSSQSHGSAFHNSAQTPFGNFQNSGAQAGSVQHSGGLGSGRPCYGRFCSG